MKALIIANGQPPSEKLLALARADADFIVATDGAGKNFAADFIIGDFDSYSHLHQARAHEEAAQNPRAHRIAKSPEPHRIAKSPQYILRPSQNSCDLAKAFKFAYAAGASRIEIIGAGGLREDHAIANFALFMQFCSIQKSARNLPLKLRMHSDFGSFLPLRDAEILRAPIGTQLSIFAKNPSDIISSKGLKFALKNMQISALNFATLNEISAPCVQLFIRSKIGRKSYALVYLSHMDLEQRLKL